MKKKDRGGKIFIFVILLFIALLYCFADIFGILNAKKMPTVDAYYIESDIPELFINDNPLDIDKIVSENRNIDIREEMIYEQLDLEYNTQYINNEKLPSGTIHISQIGVNGVQDVITIKRYNKDELISEQIVASNVRKTSVNKIVEIGTGKRKK